MQSGRAAGGDEEQTASELGREMGVILFGGRQNNKHRKFVWPNCFLIYQRTIAIPKKEV